jgi:chaperonin GroES
MSLIVKPGDPMPVPPLVGDSPGEYGRLVVPNVEIVGPRLLVAPKPKRDLFTKAGLVIPERAQDNSQEGVVVLVGDGLMLEDGSRIPPRVQPGQAIIYARYAGVELEMEGQQFLIIQESDIRCILTYKGLIFTIADEVE